MLITILEHEEAAEEYAI